MVPYVVENVESPSACRHMGTHVVLCGCMWEELQVLRPRIFASNFPLPPVPHDKRLHRDWSYGTWVKSGPGRPLAPGQRQLFDVSGTFVSGRAPLADFYAAMGYPQLTAIGWDGLKNSVPAPFVEWAARALIDVATRRC